MIRRLYCPEDVFNPEDVDDANERWGCNCGPAALAMITGQMPDAVLPYIPCFAERGYTNPSMMQAAILSLGIECSEVDDGIERKLLADPTFPSYGLVRIQWGGPWLKPGVPIAARYTYTHWIATLNDNGDMWVYDVNSGWVSRRYWEDIVVPSILTHIKRSTHDWYPTHRWELSFPKDE